MCLRVWERGFESNNINKMEVRKIVATIDIAHTIRVVDARKMMKP
jgi:hypothetical protein